jgi:tRNA(adenine34) deaminase
MNSGDSSERARASTELKVIKPRGLRRFDMTDDRSSAGDLGSLDLAMMRQALVLAREAIEFGEVPVGAVVVRDGRIVSQAFNLRETYHDPTAHAERVALTLAGRALGSWRLEGCTLYVTLEPCAMCAGAIILSRVDRLVYGATDPKAGACESLYRLVEDPRFNHRPAVTAGVLADDCGQLLTRFFRARRPTRQAVPSL